MPARYELKRTDDRKAFYWTLQGNNNEVLLTSETFPAKASAQNGIESARENSRWDHRYDRRTASNGQYYFVLRGANNEVLATGETYPSRQAMENGIEACKTHGRTAPVADQT